MTRQELHDAFLNGGVPQMTLKTDKGEELSKQDVREIYNQIKDFDNYYKSGWKESKTRKILVEFVNQWCDDYRCFSLIIK